MAEAWSEELFPGIFAVGHADDTGGNQTVIIDKDDRHYVLVTEGYDYGSWIGLRLELTSEERDEALAWAKDTYDFTKWLQKLWKMREDNKNADSNV